VVVVVAAVVVPINTLMLQKNSTSLDDSSEMIPLIIRGGLV